MNKKITTFDRAIAAIQKALEEIESEAFKKDHPGNLPFDRAVRIYSSLRWADLKIVNKPGALERLPKIEPLKKPDALPKSWDKFIELTKEIAKDPADVAGLPYPDPEA